MLFAEHPELNEGIHKVVERAMTDPAFRALCLKDPGAAFAVGAGIPLPEGFKLRFHEDAGMELALGLPPVISGADPLSDSELEEVTGAGSLWSTCCWAYTTRGC